MKQKIVIPKAIVYTELHDLSEKNLYKRAQGAPVLIFEEGHSAEEIESALKILRRISPEIVLKKENGDYEIVWSIYDEPVVRPGVIKT